MGRIASLDGDLVIHPALPLSLVVAATAATIAIITGLCGFWRKPPPDLSAPPQTADKSSNLDVSRPPQQAATTTTTSSAAVDTEEVIKELPPPPCMRALTMTNSCNNLMTKSDSTRKISSTLSVKKNFRSISVRQVIEKNRQKPEDSIWTKTIILGGKCKVSYDVDDDDDDGNGKLNTVPAAHPKTQTISGSNSLKNPDTIADKDEKGMTRNEEEGS